jgi:putative SOS response-associated peptidase YedK
MCGRLSQATSAEKAQRILDIINSLDMEARYNIAPSQSIAAVRQDSNHNNKWAILHWGLIPFWAKEKKIGYKMINAKAETLGQKPAFRNAYKNHRCIIPADGFYEWKKIAGAKQPYYIRNKTEEPLMFAGLWERWKGEGEEIESCTIITTPANDLIKPLHDRMPAIITKEMWNKWLDPEITDVSQFQVMLAPYPSKQLTAYAVSRMVNTPANDSPECIEPVEEVE